MVEFEVARVDDGADRGPEVDAAGIRNGMADVEESEFERTGFEFVPGLHDVQISVIDFRFLELAFDEAAGEACRIDWRFDIP